MVVYAVLNNLVPIIMQRFNRPGIQSLLKRLQKRASLESDNYSPRESQKALISSFM